MSTYRTYIDQWTEVCDASHAPFFFQSSFEGLGTSQYVTTNSHLHLIRPLQFQKLALFSTSKADKKAKGASAAMMIGTIFLISSLKTILKQTRS